MPDPNNLPPVWKPQAPTASMSNRAVAARAANIVDRVFISLCDDIDLSDLDATSSDAYEATLDALQTAGGRIEALCHALHDAPRANGGAA